MAVGGWHTPPRCGTLARMAEIAPAAARRAITLSAVTATLCVGIGLAAWVRRGHPFDRTVLKAASQYDLPPGLLAAVIWQESRFDPSALGRAGEIGLMQITEGAAADWARAREIPPPAPASLWHPATNITVGAWYLARAVDYWDARHCPDPYPFALAEYNAGRTRARAWFTAGGPDARAFLDAVDIPTTRTYIHNILTRYRRRES